MLYEKILYIFIVSTAYSFALIGVGLAVLSESLYFFVCSLLFGLIQYWLYIGLVYKHPFFYSDFTMNLTAAIVTPIVAIIHAWYVYLTIDTMFAVWSFPLLPIILTLFITGHGEIKET